MGEGPPPPPAPPPKTGGGEPEAHRFTSPLSQSLGEERGVGGRAPGTALVTGITGFVGAHLAEHLLANGVGVIGIRSRAGAAGWAARRCRTFQVDIRDAEA